MYVLFSVEPRTILSWQILNILYLYHFQCISQCPYVQAPAKNQLVAMLLVCQTSPFPR